MPDCITRVGYTNSSISHNNSTIASNIISSIAGTSTDVTDDTTVISKIHEITHDMPLDHRLPSPEEQCQIIALK